MELKNRHLLFGIALIMSLISLSILHAREPQTSPPNLLENGDFSAGSEYWETDGGEIIPDLDDPTRKILRLPLPDSVGAVSQKLSLPSGPLSLDFKCRLRAASASERNPVLVRVRLYDEKGNSLIIGGLKISENKKWHTLSVRSVKPREPFRDKLVLEAITGQGPLLIADVVLRYAK